MLPTTESNRMERLRHPGIVLADDHAPSLQKLRQLLNHLSHCRVLAEATNGRDAVAAVALHQPDLLLLDISMPVMNGLEAARLVKDQYPATHILFVSGQVSRAYIRAAFAAGASGFVNKARADKDIPAAIQHVLAGHTFLSSGLPA